ncbi:hypothetical protein D2V17_07040 [Aurantiacibacter xanthus]|uniref:DUF418 domain-containing protein n=1 Tax=Aurantiacibacter xanthus TaxID=1784712 RepID=A0A3A1P599_9SPHN|nr:hypothetical protein [Aurantiacibacter xanthus]RIV88639.1 hypothetical protein D2V17_07040 [Aurantiacibacter xanthus]
MGDFVEDPWVDALRICMAAATPTFIILFGTMLEIVYRPRFIAGHRKTITVRLVSRATQCWLLYALSIGVLFLMRDDYSAAFSIATVLMLGVTPFTDILKFYAVVLVLAPLLLWVRCRLGLVPLAAGAIAVHLAYPLLTALPTPNELGLSKELARLWKFLFGLGEAQLGGPSIMRGITLVIAGMVLGRILIGSSGGRPDMARLRHRTKLLLAGAGISLAVLFAAFDQSTIKELGTMSLRMAGHPLYFLFGVHFAVVLMAATTLLTTSVKADRFWRNIAFFGRTSLFTFAFGNMLLYCVTAEPENLAAALQLVAVLVVTIITLSVWFDLTMRRKGWIAHCVIELQRMITSFVNSLISGPAAKLSLLALRSKRSGG